MVEYLEAELSDFCKKLDVFKESELVNILENVKSGKSSSTNMLWTVYFLIQWYNRWLKDE